MVFIFYFSSISNGTFSCSGTREVNPVTHFNWPFLVIIYKFIALICLRLYDENGGLLSTSYNMSNTFNDASMIVNQAAYLDAVIRGLLIQPSQSVDNFVVDDLWNSLFKYKSNSKTFLLRSFDLF